MLFLIHQFYMEILEEEKEKGRSRMEGRILEEREEEGVSLGAEVGQRWNRHHQLLFRKSLIVLFKVLVV